MKELIDDSAISRILWSHRLTLGIWNTKIRNWFCSEKASVRAESASALVWHLGWMVRLECREHRGTVQCTPGKLC